MLFRSRVDKVPYIFNVRAGVNCNHVAVLDAQVVAGNTGKANAAFVELVVGQDDQDCVFPFLAANEDGVATEELQGVHGAGSQHDNRVVIVGRVSDAVFC